MGTIAILGATEVDGELATQSLSDMRDAAIEADANFDLIVGVDDASPEVIPTILDWCIEEEVSFDLIVHPDVADQIPEKYTNAADKVIKTKLVDGKTVERLIEYGGSELLVLAGDEAPSESLQKVALIAHEADIPVLDLADALTPIDFGGDTTDAPADVVDTADAIDEEKPDFEQIGTAADDEDDAAAQAKLTEWANEADIPEDEQNSLTWTELAEKLSDLYDEATTPAPAKTAAAKKTPSKKAAAPAKAEPDDTPTGFTAEVLDGKPLKELRIIGTQSGIAGADKMGLKALKEKLLGLDAPADQPDDQDIAEAAAPAKSKAKVANVGKPLAGSPDTGNTEVDEALAQINQGLTRLVNALLK